MINQNIFFKFSKKNEFIQLKIKKKNLKLNIILNKIIFIIF
jgi:hypothetical protein